MPFIGNPNSNRSLSVWLDEKKEIMDLAIIDQNWAAAIPVILEAIEKCELWDELDRELSALWDRLAICYAGLGQVAESDNARATAVSIRERQMRG